MAIQKLVLKGLIMLLGGIGAIVMGYGIGSALDSVDEAFEEAERINALSGEGEVK